MRNVRQIVGIPNIILNRKRPQCEQKQKIVAGARPKIIGNKENRTGRDKALGTIMKSVDRKQ